MTLRPHTVYEGLQGMYGSLTLTGALFQEASTCAFVSDGSKDYNSRPRGPDFHLEFFPLHSPLLKESKFVSFPLLTYMLKFSRFAILTSGRQSKDPKFQLASPLAPSVAAACVKQTITLKTFRPPSVTSGGGARLSLPWEWIQISDEEEAPFI